MFGWDMVIPITAVIATKGCLEQQIIFYIISCLQPVTGGLSNNRGLFEIIVVVLTTCHTQYT